MAMSESDITARLETWAAAFTADRADEFVSLYQPDATVEDLSTKQKFSGHAEIRAWLEGYAEVTRDSEQRLLSVLTGAGHAVAQWEWEATLAVVPPIFPPTAVVGSTFVVQGVSIMEFTDDGLIGRVQSYWNLADLVQQICAPAEAPVRPA